MSIVSQIAGHKQPSPEHQQQPHPLEAWRRFLQLKKHVAYDESCTENQAVIDDIARPDKISQMSMRKKQVEQQPVEGLEERHRCPDGYQCVKYGCSYHDLALLCTTGARNFFHLQKFFRRSRGRLRST